MGVCFDTNEVDADFKPYDNVSTSSFLVAAFCDGLRYSLSA